MNSTIIVKDDNERLDVFVCKNISNISRSRVKNLIEEGKILLNNKKVKAGEMVCCDDQVYVEIPENVEPIAQPENIPLNIVYEDSDLLVINKPRNMVVHPATKNYSHTLVNALLYNVKDLSGINGVLRPGIVHRLDKDTTGLLLVAKNDFAHINLSEQIAKKECKRFYLAILQGNVKEDEGEIITHIGRDVKNRLKMAVVDNSKGKIAHTKYKVIERFNGYTYVEFELLTGRTHQIRVHSAHINHAVLGDKLYNSTKCNFNTDGQFLHAYKIEFTHPRTNKKLCFQIPLNEDFERVLNILRNK